MSLFLMEGFPGPFGFGRCFISVNFDNFLINRHHSLFAMRDEFKYLTKHCMLFSFVPQ